VLDFVTAAGRVNITMNQCLISTATIHLSWRGSWNPHLTLAQRMGKKIELQSGRGKRNLANGTIPRDMYRHKEDICVRMKGER